jgi:SAM-dependent methyltransferase
MINYLILFFCSLSLGQGPSLPLKPASTQPTTQPIGDPRAVRLLMIEAKALEPLVKTDWVKSFLSATRRLPPFPSRTLLRDEKKNVYFNASQAVTLGDVYRETLVLTELAPSFYYYTRYGSPLAYARPLDLLGQRGFTNLPEKKILDFGYGGVGQLRLLASLGAVVVGVDVDPLLYALYSDPADQGAIIGEGGTAGSLTLLYGKYPADQRMVAEVGAGYDLVISKNTLKMGYIHPMRKADKRQLIDLGVDDAVFVRSIYDILKPGGYFMVYNLCPAPSPADKPFVPWSDGRFPFARKVCESLGFKVLEFQTEDSDAARQMGHALAWDEGKDGMDLKNDLFASYTLLQKPESQK